MDKHHEITKRVMTDVIKFYRTFFVMSSLAKTVRVLNYNDCYFVTYLVGRVLSEKYGINVRYYCHCLHAWLNVDGVDYDTLYPSGYDKPVVEEWWLDRRGYNADVMEMIYGYVGGIPCGHDYHYFTKAFFERWGLSEGKLASEMLDSLDHYWQKESTLKRRDKRFKRRYLKYRTLPLFEYDKGVENLTKPHTHYYKGEFE